MSKFKWFEFLSALGTIIVGTLLHFVYAASGNNRLVAIFAAVNESTWEHLKLAFWPAFIFALVGYLVFGRKEKNFCFAQMIKLFLMPLLIVGLFYGWLLFYADNFIYDISIFVMAVILGHLAAYFVERSKARFGNKVFSSITILILLIIFSMYTKFPPKNFLFRDPITGGYGLETSEKLPNNDAFFVYKIWGDPTGSEKLKFYIYQDGKSEEMKLPVGSLEDVLVDNGRIVEIGEDWTIYQYDREKDESQAIAKAPNKVYSAILSTDSSKLAYLDVTKEDRQEVDLHIYNRLTKKDEIITHLDGHYLQGFVLGSWPKDNIVYIYSEAADAGNVMQEIYRVKIDEKTTSEISRYSLTSFDDGTNGELIQKFTGDGKVITLYEVGNKDKSTEKTIKEIDLETGDLTELFRQTDFLADSEQIFESMSITFDQVSRKVYYDLGFSGDYSGVYSRSGIEKLGFFEVTTSGNSQKLGISPQNIKTVCSPKLDGGNSDFVIYTDILEVNKGSQSKTYLYQKSSDKKVLINESTRPYLCHSDFDFIGWVK